MKILGIDPGYAIVGWGVVDLSDGNTIRSAVTDRSSSVDLVDSHESNLYGGDNLVLLDCGVITTSSDLQMGERLLEIYNDLQEIIKEFKPDLIGLETLLFQTNAKTAMAVSEARGVISLAAQQAAIATVDVTPLQVKSSIAGYGKASKSQVQENVRLFCNLEKIPQPDDAADAVAIAITARALYRERSLNMR